MIDQISGEGLHEGSIYGRWKLLLQISDPEQLVDLHSRQAQQLRGHGPGASTMSR